MKISTASTFIGPNIYSSKSAIKYGVDLSAYADSQKVILEPAFVHALLEHLPALENRIDDLPAEWNRNGASLAYLFMLVAIELQKSIGGDIGTGDVRPTSVPGLYHVIYGYEDAGTGLAAGGLAALLIQNLPLNRQPRTGNGGRGFDFARARENFVRTARRNVMNVEQRYVVDAARSRDIPVDRLGEGLFLFGQGRFQKRRFRHFSNQTSHIGFVLSSNKALTNRILGEIGLPVPQQRVVGTKGQAVVAATRIGYPVVVKPLDSDFGRGVSVGLKDAKSVGAAFDRARYYRQSVIVESFIAGDDHRLLIVDGQLVAAAKRTPARVIGDGSKTIEQLIEEANLNPWRGVKGLQWLPRLEFDDETNRMLAEAGYTPETVPDRGETVHLRNASNLASGGTSIDVTDKVHPDNRQLAILAAATIGIDVAGVDFITTDISQSYREIGGAICEINTTPGLNPHVAIEGRPRDIAGPIIDAMYPPGAPSRIPVAVITGLTGRTETARILAHILAQVGHFVGLSTSEGVSIDGVPTADGATTGGAAARMILRHPMVDAAVLEISPDALMRNGLGFDGCDVAAILDADSAASSGNSTLSSVDLVQALGVAVKAARNVTVINAADELCRNIANDANAGRVLLTGVQENVLSDIGLMDGWGDHTSDVYRRNVLFAATIAQCLGRSAEEIRNAVRSFVFDAL